MAFDFDNDTPIIWDYLETNITEPDENKVSTGFITDEVLPSDTHNWLLNYLTSGLSYALGKIKELETACPYRVGGIFLTATPVDPSTIWVGTTWKKLEGRYLKASSNSEIAMTMGGSAVISLLASQLPTHTHQVIGGTYYTTYHKHTMNPHSHNSNHNHKVAGERDGKNNYGQTGSSIYWGFGESDQDNPLAYTSTESANVSTVTTTMGNSRSTVTIPNKTTTETQTRGQDIDNKPLFVTLGVYRRIT